MTDFEKINSAYQEWKNDLYQKSLDRFPARLDRFSTVSDLEVDELGVPIQADYNEELGLPGQYPYTRGVYPSMYRGRMWTMRQFAGFGTPENTNERYHYLLKNGQTGLSVAFHYPTLMGYDSDHPRSLGEVGVCGVAIDSLRDMEVLFDGINLEDITTSMTINGPASILLMMYEAVAKKQGANVKKISGTIQNDILKEYIAQKSWIFPPRPSLRIITDIFGHCVENIPRWNTISISGYHIREAGSTAAQELAFTLADGLGYVQAGVDAGLDVDSFAPRLSFFFNAHLDFFEEIAKFRAARRIWAREMKKRFGAKNPQSTACRFHTQTAGCSLTAQQPYNNVVRTALQGMSAVLGGTQSLHTNSLDETLALPTEHSVTIALRTQQIIAHETGIAEVIDPFAGSYFVEALTDRLEEEAMRYITKIDELGGIVAAIETGYPQMEIADAAYHYQKQVEAGEKVIIGVNKHQLENDPPIPTLKIDKAVEKMQVENLGKVRDVRNQAAVDSALKELSDAAAGDENLLPFIGRAISEYATLGEICDCLREVFGEYHDPAYI